MNKKRIVSLLIIVLLLASSLFAENLDSIITKAKQNSSTIQLLNLSKRNSDLSLELSDLEGTLGISVSGGVTYLERDYGTILDSDIVPSIVASPTVSLILPNDGNTSISFSATNISRTFGSKDYWGANPSIGVSHTFRFGDTGDILDDLKLSKQRVEIEQTYQKRILDFESSIYAKIAEILNLEITLLNNEKDLYVQRTKVENAQKLRSSSEDSIAFRSLTLELSRLENVKAGNLQKLMMAQKQYEQLTGLKWDGVENIKESDLNFVALPTGDSSVLLASLDLEIAKENLALNRRTTTKTERGSTVPTLTVGGNAGITYQNNVLGTELDYKIGANTNYSAKNFSTGASVSLNISDTGKVTPTLTISGSWSNNQSLASDKITVQSLENSVTIAQFNYQEALLDYQIKANQLENDILSYRLDIERYKESVALRNQSLVQIKEAFEMGLVTQTDVDKALLDVELIKYETKINALQALILENKIKGMGL
jgi:outer membrane protein TolC